MKFHLSFLLAFCLNAHSAVVWFNALGDTNHINCGATNSVTLAITNQVTIYGTITAPPTPPSNLRMIYATTRFGADNRSLFGPGVISTFADEQIGFAYRTLSIDGNRQQAATGTHIFATNGSRAVAVSFIYGTGASIKFATDGLVVAGTWEGGTSGNVIANPGDFTMQNCIGWSPTTPGDDFALTSYGIISEVAIWDVALTSGQIRNLTMGRLRGMPLQINPSHLMGYWALNQHPEGRSLTDGAIFPDFSGNHNTGVVAGNLVGTAERALSYLPNE